MKSATKFTNCRINELTVELRSSTTKFTNCRINELTVELTN